MKTPITNGGENKMVDISVVIPVYNEEGNLHELHRRLKAVFENELQITYEILFVDDGSKDKSWSIIEELYNNNTNVKGIKFSRNYGHHIAITAGMDYSKGKSVLLMDADLQDQPEEIPKLYKKHIEGFDVVYGIRNERQHSFFKRLTSNVFILLMNRIIDSDTTINSHIFRIMSRKVVDTINQFRERERFITGLIGFVGFEQIGVNVEHSTRFAGETKYTLSKMIKLALNTLTSFSYKPLQLASLLGVVVSFLSFVGILYLIVRKVFFNMGIAGWTSTIIIILFIGGVQMLFLGILGEYIGRIYTESQKRPLYVISDKLDVEQQ